MSCGTQDRDRLCVGRGQNVYVHSCSMGLDALAKDRRILQF